MAVARAHGARRMSRVTLHCYEHVICYATELGRLVVKCTACGESRTFSAPNELGPKRTWKAADRRLKLGVDHFNDAHQFCPEVVNCRT
jgi:hypothetical protein